MYSYFYMYHKFLFVCCCSVLLYIYFSNLQVSWVIFPTFSDTRQRNDGTCENADDEQISYSMGKVEHVIFLMHDVIIIIYISRSKCILEWCVILICIRWYCVLLISSVLHLYDISWSFLWFMFFDLSYVIHVYIHLSLDKTQLSKGEMEPVLMQISKGKTLFWHIYLFETLWSSLSSWETGDYSHT